ncbi:MAG: (2Fe-2S)-binding protein [Planctomycetes bacterium]|nr:(2Fe-2S)-binding protein [Planctomycetota bacterium]
MSGRVDGLGERDPIVFTFDGRTVEALAGDTVAMALWAAGTRELRHSSRDGAPRSMLCAMGICYECLVVIDGEHVRACMTEARSGMNVRRGGRP